VAAIPNLKGLIEARFLFHRDQYGGAGLLSIVIS